MRAKVEGVDFHYELMGEGIPAVMIHGYTVDHRLMSGCFEPILSARSGYKRLYFDLPGMGQTPRAPGIPTSDGVLDLVEKLVDRLLGDEPFLLAGESYGGYLARGLAFRNPDRVLGLALLCPLIIPDRTRRKLPQHEALVHEAGVLEGLDAAEREEFEPMAVVITERTSRRFREEILPALRLADMQYLERLRTRYQLSFDPDAPSFSFPRPTLILTGRQDASVGFEDAWPLLRNYPHATFAAVDRAGHNLQIEQEGLFNALVEEWLDRCATTPRP